MRLITGFALAGTASLFAFTSSAYAQTTLTASSWVPPTHSLTKGVLVPWTQEVEKVTQGRVKFNVLPKAPMAAPSTFDGV